MNVKLLFTLITFYSSSLFAQQCENIKLIKRKKYVQIIYPICSDSSNYIERTFKDSILISQKISLNGFYISRLDKQSKRSTSKKYLGWQQHYSRFFNEYIIPYDGINSLSEVGEYSYPANDSIDVTIVYGKNNTINNIKTINGNAVRRELNNKIDYYEGIVNKGKVNYEKLKLSRKTNLSEPYKDTVFNFDWGVVPSYFYSRISTVTETGEWQSLIGNVAYDSKTQKRMDNLIFNTGLKKPTYIIFIDSIGKIRYEGAYRSGDCVIGQWISYYDNGNISCIENFEKGELTTKDSSVMKNCSKKEGISICFDYNGDTLFTEKWVKGKFVNQNPNQNKCEISGIYMLNGDSLIKRGVIQVSDLNRIKFSTYDKTTTHDLDIDIWLHFVMPDNKVIDKKMKLKEFESLDLKKIKNLFGISNIIINGSLIVKTCQCQNWFFPLNIKL